MQWNVLSTRYYVFAEYTLRMRLCGADCMIRPYMRAGIQASVNISTVSCEPLRMS